MNLRLQTEEIKMRVGKLLGGKCFVCSCEISRRGMVVHHLWYIFADIIYKNYGRNDSGRLQYYTDLEPLVIKEKNRFMFLCNPCHTSLEKLCRFGDKKLKRLLIARRMTKAKR